VAQVINFDRLVLHLSVAPKPMLISRIGPSRDQRSKK
jgi:hypothetical protein